MTAEGNGFDLKSVSAVPVMFFTVNGGGICNPASARVIEVLEDYIHERTVSCTVFENVERCWEALRGIPPQRLVVFFDRTSGIHYFRPFFRRDSASFFPSWSARAWWGQGINPLRQRIIDPNDREQRSKAVRMVHLAARQAAADFHTHYLENVLKKEMLPFGKPVDPKAASRRRERRNQKRKGRVRCERPLFY